MTLIQRIDASRCGCDRAEGGTALTGMDAALSCIARRVSPVTGIDRVPLARARGRVLASPVRALGLVPPFDNAAMDGFALRTADLSGVGPWTLAVTGRVAAGHAATAFVTPQTAVQIFTGAPVPAGADAVVMREDVRVSGDRLRIVDPVEPGSHIRRAGEDMKAGKIMVPAGQLITERSVATCAAAGHETLEVSRRLRVALVVTGDEVCAQGTARGDAGIWDVNTPMLSSALDIPMVDFVGAFRAADTPRALRAQLDDLADKVDLIVTTGGLSVGEEDHVRPALSDLGADIGFAGVAVKPGKPVAFGHLRRSCWLGLPGNPLAAFVTWQVFGRAVCATLAGLSQPLAPRRHAVLARGLHHQPGRCELRLGRIIGCDGSGREVVDFPDKSQSGRVAQLAQADGLLFIPADARDLPEAALVEFQTF